MIDSLCDKIRYFYWDTISYDWRPGQIWYRIKCRLWHKYNVVKLKRLPSTWSDRDHILFHACMQIMEDFVEKEKPYERIVTKGGNNDTEWAELKEIYDWWKKYPEPYKSQEEALNKELDACEPLELFSDDDKKILPNGSIIYTMKLPNEDRHNIYKKIWALEEKVFNDEQEMLQRLIKIRRLLWT